MGLKARLAAVLLATAGLIGIVHAELAGAPAPDFALKSVNGKNYRLSEYRGRVVLLSFGASWCGECRTQLETLSDLQQRYAGSGLEVLLVSLDSEMNQVDDLARALDIEFPALHDAGGAVGEHYSVRKLPYAVLIDQEGVVRSEYDGFQKGEEERYLADARSLLTW
jgi:peroxiredoxin